MEPSRNRIKDLETRCEKLTEEVVLSGDMIEDLREEIIILKIELLGLYRFRASRCPKCVEAIEAPLNQ